MELAGTFYTKKGRARGRFDAIEIFHRWIRYDLIDTRIPTASKGFETETDACTLFFIRGMITLASIRLLSAPVYES